MPRPFAKRTIIRRMLRKFFADQFRMLDLLPEYAVSVKRLGWDKAWGPAVLCIAYCILWFRTDPPPWYVTMAFICGLILIVGYYLWRADHIRLIPQLTVADTPHLQETPVEQGNERRIFVRIRTKVLNGFSRHRVSGHLLRVYKRWGDEEWELTEMGERILLDWSHYGAVPITIYPSGGQYLNICWRSSSIDILIPSCTPRPSRWREVFNDSATFRFDVEITSKDCLPVKASVMVTSTGNESNKPTVKVVRTEEAGK